MKLLSLPRFCHFAATIGVSLAFLLTAILPAFGGLTMEIHLYSYGQGKGFSFYTPLLTNATTPSAPLGTYIIRSPQWPTNGSQRGFDLTASGINDRYEFDGEYGYGDLASALFQITNGTWSIIFTNATVTNQFNFTASAPAANSNTFPSTIIMFPADGSYILNAETNFTWQGASSWGVSPLVVSYNDSFYQNASLSPAQTNWDVSGFLATGTNYTFFIQYLLTNAFFSSTVPLNTNNSQPISGWNVMTILDSGSSVTFNVIAGRAAPASGHTCMAYYTFEDDTIPTQDFSGNGNAMSDAWFAIPPYIASGDAAAGNYAGAFNGSGWFTPPDSLRSLFEGSFSVSLWLKTTNTDVNDNADEYSAAGIVSVLNNDYNNGVMPMGRTGNKLAFYTGGSLQNIMHSKASINTGQYVHVAVTRDQQTGEKRIYVNGVLDSSVFANTNLLNGSSAGGLTVGYNNGSLFGGEMDEIQFYSGVLSSNDVAFLHSNPGLNVQDTPQLAFPVARYDFENTNTPGSDSSGRHNDANCGSQSGPKVDIPSTNAAIGNYSREYFGDTSICFTSGSQGYNSLSNAFAGSFSVTAWVSTTNSVNADFANACYGMPIVMLYNTTTNGAVPLSITGSKAAFTVSNPSGTDTTIHSTTSVNDGRYHFLAVTRSQTDGLMSLYVDGMLEATGICNTAAIRVPSTINLAGGYFSYQGFLDDVRVYKGTLTTNDVASLASEGSQVQSFDAALGTLGLIWKTTGEASWFVENTDTYNGAPEAVQSGSVTNSQSTTLSVTVTGPGKLDFVWSSIANDPNQGFDCEFYIDDPGTNDIADLYGNNDWQSIQQSTGGPVIVPPGVHTLNWVVYANGDTDPTEAAFLDQVEYATTDTSPVSANIALDIYREQDSTFGDIFIAFPSINSITPAPIGTTTNYLQSPSGWFNAQADPGNGGSSSAIVSSLAQLLGECTNGLWSLYINKGTVLERQFQFNVHISGLTTNLLSAVKITTPTNNASSVPANTAFQWSGPVTYSSLSVFKQKIDGTSQASATLPVTATSWPTPPVLEAGTNEFDIDYISNNFPSVVFSLPTDTNDTQTISSWATQVNLHSTAKSIFIVTAGATPVRLLSATQNASTFQFQFQSQSGFTNSIQYRTNLAAGNNWQTYTKVTGDGTLKTIIVPMSAFNPSKQGFIRVLTQ